MFGVDDFMYIFFVVTSVILAFSLNMIVGIFVYYFLSEHDVDNIFELFATSLFWPFMIVIYALFTDERKEKESRD